MDMVKIIDQINTDVAEAKDNLLLAKVFQVDQVNKKCGPEDIFKVNDSHAIYSK